ncbi:hypothetical protein [Bradyrhizobium sp.]|uniref:hypothetical protein n=1 Tax=Bradyrhizobium sp. TaxID=376 RepID=UPI003C16FA9F
MSLAMGALTDPAKYFDTSGKAKAAAAVQVKLSSHGYHIDHPDSEAGDQLMADALGVADRDAMNGILRQLVGPA